MINKLSTLFSTPHFQLSTWVWACPRWGQAFRYNLVGACQPQQGFPLQSFTQRYKIILTASKKPVRFDWKMFL
ncbi:hypothetical protein EZS27_026912 [termite gut metagenome]|uniref:Uncharacterized protein n=1 Tax=termite gut metagenome TaxID=433724 RepID=A0A5J4QS15_9ZZZZ